PVESVRLNGPPLAPAAIPAHLSPISPPDRLSPGSNQPSPNGSVIVPAYSAPPTMLHPSLFPPGAGLTASTAHFMPASIRYGRVVYGPFWELWEGPDRGGVGGRGQTAPTD